MSVTGGIMAKDEAEKQKSLVLAELMGWKVKLDSLSSKGHPLIECDSYNFIYHSYLSPYKHTAYSMAQFAIIMLKFPDVMIRMDTRWYIGFFEDDDGWVTESIWLHREPTQSNILDEILAMNGLWQKKWSRYDERSGK